MEEFKNITENSKYYLAHDGLDIFHYGELLSSQVVATGQPFLEIFNTENELNDRLNELQGK